MPFEMSFPAILGLSFAAIILFMSALWLLSLRLKDAAIADIFWGTGFVILALITLLSPAATFRAGSGSWPW